MRRLQSIAQKWVRGSWHVSTKLDRLTPLHHFYHHCNDCCYYIKANCYVQCQCWWYVVLMLMLLLMVLLLLMLLMLPLLLLRYYYNYYDCCCCCPGRLS